MSISFGTLTGHSSLELVHGRVWSVVSSAVCVTSVPQTGEKCWMFVAPQQKGRKRCSRKKKGSLGGGGTREGRGQRRGLTGVQCGSFRRYLTAGLGMSLLGLGGREPDMCKAIFLTLKD